MRLQRADAADTATRRGAMEVVLPPMRSPGAWSSQRRSRISDATWTQGLDLLVGTQCLPRLNVGQPLNVLIGARPIDLLVNRRMLL